MHNDRGTLSLLANNPFPDKPPHFIRAQLYRYHFAPLGEKGWWRRELVGEWLPPLSVEDQRLHDFMGLMHWLDYGESH